MFSWTTKGISHIRRYTEIPIYGYLEEHWLWTLTEENPKWRKFYTDVNDLGSQKLDTKLGKDLNQEHSIGVPLHDVYFFWSLMLLQSCICISNIISASCSIASSLINPFCNMLLIKITHFPILIEWVSVSMVFLPLSSILTYCVKKLALVILKR